MPGDVTDPETGEVFKPSDEAVEIDMARAWSAGLEEPEIPDIGAMIAVPREAERLEKEECIGMICWTK